MKKSHWLVCLLGLTLSALLLTAPLAGASTVDPVDKPTVYEFGRRLCPICLKNALVLEEVRATYPDQISLRFLYVDTEEHLFRRFGVTFVPTQVFLDAAGNEVYRHEGPLSKDELIATLKRLNFIRD